MRSPSGTVFLSVAFVLGLAAHVGAQAPQQNPDRIGPPALEGPAPGRPAAVGAAAPAVQPSTGQPSGGAPAGVVPVAGTPAARAPGAASAAPAAAPASQPSMSGRKPHFAPVIPPKDYSPPILHLDQPRHDFGKVFKGEVVTHRFELENKGGAPLVLGQIRPSCGCTVVDQSSIDRVIAPSAKGGFELRLETSRLPVGRQQKYADVPSNDPKQATMRVFISGMVEALLKVEPEAPRLQTVRGKDQGSLELTLTNTSGTQLKLLSVKCLSGRLITELKEVTPGMAWKVLVKTNYGPKDTQSYFSESLQLEVELGEKKMTQEIPLAVQIKDRIDVAPRSLYFKRTDFQPLKDEKKPVVKTIDLKAAVEDPYRFKVSGVKMDDPASPFKLSLEPVKEGREYRLLVTVDQLPEEKPDTKAASRTMKGNIVLSTDDPLMPEINIRCIAFY